MFIARMVFFTSLIEAEERSNVVLTQLLGNYVLTSFSEFISESEDLSSDEMRANPKILILKNFVHEQINGLNVVKIKIYNLDGLTVFSTDLAQIGASKETHPSFVKAKNGDVVSKLSFRDKIYAKEELITNRNIITSYAPIWKDNKVVSVFEVYKDVTDVVEHVSTMQIRIFFIVFSSSGILFLVLFFSIRRSDDEINKLNDAQVKATDEIRNIAFHDALTGLPNRILFVDRLEHAISLATRNENLVVLMFIDLDRFKQVNDNLGHEAGDELLKQISHRLLGLVRPCDTVSRISGDEFTVILEELNTVELATVVAKRINAEMATPFLLAGKQVFISCSIGISVYPFSDDDADSLVKKSDAAMFFSKSSGRNIYHYYSPDMQEHGSLRYELENELNVALDKSQFCILFQPKVNLTDWSLPGMEAKIRWNHPTKGIIEDEELLLLLEETGLIVKVGEWILDECCQHVKKWQDEGLPAVHVAVNISPIQLKHDGFVDTITSILENSRLEPQYLELEISERRLMDDEEYNVKIINALKDKGVHLTINEFGTGFLSLSHLSKLPIDTLKIDKSFIRDMMDDPRKRSITTAIISFAHSLKLNIIADGVDTKEQLMFVNAMRCSYAQGDLIGKYYSVDDFYEMYKSGTGFKALIESD